MTQKTLMLAFLIGLLAGCQPTRDDLLTCRGLLYVSVTAYDSAVVVNRNPVCAWYVGWKLDHAE